MNATVNISTHRNASLTDRVIRTLKHAPIWVLEHGIRDIALPAAVLSTTGGPGYVSKMTAGITTPIKILYNGAVAYVNDTGVRTLFNSFAIETIKAVGQVADNVANRLDETFYAALLTYATCKTIPAVSRWARNRYIR